VESDRLYDRGRKTLGQEAPGKLLVLGVDPLLGGGLVSRDEMTEVVQESSGHELVAGLISFGRCSGLQHVLAQGDGLAEVGLGPEAVIALEHVVDDLVTRHDAPFSRMASRLRSASRSA
jgi:hypothetical protein